MESRQLELYEGFCATYFLELTKFSNFQMRSFVFTNNTSYYFILFWLFVYFELVT